MNNFTGKYRKFNQSGMSLLMAVVSMGITGILILTITNSVNFGMKGQKEVQTLDEVTQISSSIRSAISKNSCTVSLRGFHINRGRTDQSFSPELYFPNHQGGKGRAIATVGQTYTYTRINQMQFQVDGTVGSVAYGKINVGLQRLDTSGQSSLNVSSKMLSFDVVFQLDSADNILFCLGSSNTTTVVPISVAQLQRFNSHIQLPACSDVGDSHFYFTSACHRFCSTGCPTGNPNCSSTIRGLGYSSGSAVECNYINATALCACHP